MEVIMHIFRCNQFVSMIRKTFSRSIFVNPIAKSAWQFMRMYRPELCYGSGSGSFDPNSEDLRVFLNKNDLNDQVHDQTDAFKMGFNKWAMEKDYAQNS